MRLANEGDLNRIKQIANQNREFIGFVMKVALRESILKKSLLVYENEIGIVGFIHFHKRLDGWTTLHELVVDRNYHHLGMRKDIYSYVSLPIRLKTTVDNVNARNFYKKNDMQEVRTEQGNKRESVIFESVNCLDCENIVKKLKIK